MSFQAALALAVVVFATTNVDDLLLLTAYFADRTTHPMSVIFGQAVGIGLLTLGSALAAWFALKLPSGLLSFLGLAPLILGIRGLLALWKARGFQRSNPDDSTRQLITESSVRRRIYSQWVSVALITLANGGDNLGVYIPLFSRSFQWLPLYLTTFAFMTGVWCLFSYWLVHHRIWGAYIRRYGHVALPIVLLMLGVSILSGAFGLFH